MKAVFVSPLDFGLWRQPALGNLLGHPVRTGLIAPNPSDLEAVAGWGYKFSGLRAKRFAARHGVPCWLLEDGFLRSVGLGKDDPPLSIVVDTMGIYYDAETPSLLESLISRDHTPEELSRGEKLMALVRVARVSKYNMGRDYQGELPEGFVLVADQTLGDASIRFGLADRFSFTRMLEAAIEENPGRKVVLKVHPEVATGRKRGHFDLAKVRRIEEVIVLASDAHPISFLEGASAVYTVTSQLGFEALMWGRRVRTFGMPFYGGWGLTGDDLPPPSRRGKAVLPALVHAALVEYPRYTDPETGEPSTPERVIEHLALQRSMRSRFPSTLWAAGFSRWKRPIVRDFAQGSRVRFVSDAGVVPPGETVALWGRKEGVGTPGPGVEVVRLEDGFLRSVGLGADLVRPLSWVMDRTGIYYDATVPSDLERILQEAEFGPDLVARAANLRETLRSNNLTKYNVGSGRWVRPKPDLRVILVPGQVESDASLRYGAPGLKRNIDLLRAVREANPDAYLLYKPHPDVLAGLRGAGGGEECAPEVCDEIVTDAPMGELLDAVDEVHVLTSLAGYEGLLRGKRVVVYGAPFYAGWGLTEDKVAVSRRTRRLTLDELTAGALILYPTYVSRATGKFTTPERALTELLLWRVEGVRKSGLKRRILRTVARIKG